MTELKKELGTKSWETSVFRERQRREGGGCPGQEGIQAILAPQDWLSAWGWERWLRWSRSLCQEDTCSQVSKPHRLGSGPGLAL